ncbi:hypothetical protein [Corynebacterium halotolerans]|nr:hypothetical protein [Corynebacterium halotolerans]
MAAPTFLRSSRRFLSPQFNSEGSTWGSGVAGIGFVAYLLLNNLLIEVGDNPLIMIAYVVALYAYLTVILSGDRRMYRALGMNRTRAVLQQAWISGPLSLLLLVGFIVLWDFPTLLLGIGVVTVVFAVDLAVTARLCSGERSDAGTAQVGFLRSPGARDSLIRRLIWAPLARTALPMGLVAGLVVAGAGRIHLESTEIVLLIVGVLLIYLVPAHAYLNASASAGTWQAFGLTRRRWAEQVTLAAVVTQLLAWLLAWAVVAVLARVGFTDAGLPGRLVVPVLGLAILLAGLNAVTAAGAGFDAPSGYLAVYPAAAGVLVLNLSVPVLTAVAAQVVVGLLLLIAAIWMQVHFTQGRRGGGRAILDTRKFAE